jgi:iron complex transport system ATP-binding protein
MRLHANDLTLAYDQVVVATDLSIEIPDGKVTVLIGPNGCGKSTALRALSRLLRPRAGEVVLDGKSIQQLTPKQVAQKLAILPQLLIAPESITVEELVSYGRHPQRKSMLSLTDEDRAAIEWAIEVTGMQALRYRPVDQLSGGQRQRAWIALVLAQGTDLILLDEPTTFLDIAYQLDVLELLRDLNAREGKTIVMVLHDINLAAEYAHLLLAMKDGRLVAAGTPKEILTKELIHDVFGIASHVMDHPVTGQPMCLPIPSPERAGLTAPAPVVAPAPA